MDNPAFLGKEEFQIIYIGFHFESTTVVVYESKNYKARKARKARNSRNAQEAREA